MVKLASNAVLPAGPRPRAPSDSPASTVAPPPTLIVSADRDRISQVFTNLIRNIVRYTPDTARRNRAAATPPSWNCATALASNETDRGRVFERFYRADSSRNRRSGGSGLGLAVVSGIPGRPPRKRLPDETKGGGLTVRIRLPMA